MTNNITSRERVQKVLNHQDPDRVPVILGGSANHLTEQRYLMLRNHFEVDDIPRRTLVGYYTTPDYNPVLDQLETDFRFLHLRPPDNFISNSLVEDFKEFTDEWGLTHNLMHGHYILEGSPLGGDLTRERIDRFSWPDPYDPVRFRGLKK